MKADTAIAVSLISKETLFLSKISFSAISAVTIKDGD